MKKTNGQSELQSKLSVIITKKRKREYANTKNHETLKIRFMSWKALKRKAAKKLLKNSPTATDVSY